MSDDPPPGPAPAPATPVLTRVDAEEQLQRIVGLTARAIAGGHPTHLALAALETHVAHLLDRVFTEARRG